MVMLIVMVMMLLTIVHNDDCANGAWKWWFQMIAWLLEKVLILKLADKMMGLYFLSCIEDTSNHWMHALQRPKHVFILSSVLFCSCKERSEKFIGCTPVTE